MLPASSRLLRAEAWNAALAQRQALAPRSPVAALGGLLAQIRAAGQ